MRSNSSRMAPMAVVVVEMCNKRVQVLAAIASLVILLALFETLDDTSSIKQPMDVRLPMTRLNLLNLNKKFEREFEQIAAFDCNVSNLSVVQPCLGRLAHLGNEMRRQKEQHLLNYDKCAECTEASGGGDDDDSRRRLVFYHTFWQLSERSVAHVRVMKLAIMSYLATQNLCCTKLIFWRLAEFPADVVSELSAVFARHIQSGALEFRLFDIVAICRSKRTFLAKKPMCGTGNNETEALERGHLIALSDFVRFVVLDIYEGIYVDGDIMFLRDMRLLWHKNFAYRWSYADAYNTAVMGLSRVEDEASVDQLYKLVSAKCEHFETCVSSLHPFYLSRWIGAATQSVFSNKLLRMFSSFLFDAAWLCNDSRSKLLHAKSSCAFHEFRTKEIVKRHEFNMSLFYDGSFTYHIHLGDMMGPIKTDSYFMHIENHFKKLLNII